MPPVPTGRSRICTNNHCRAPEESEPRRNGVRAWCRISHGSGRHLRQVDSCYLSMICRRDSGQRGAREAAQGWRRHTASCIPMESRCIAMPVRVPAQCSVTDRNSARRAVGGEVLPGLPHMVVTVWSRHSGPEPSHASSIADQR